MADKFKPERVHHFLCANEEFTVVLDLHKWNATFFVFVLLLSGEEMRLWFGEVGDEPIEPRLEMCSGFDRRKEFDFLGGGCELPSCKSISLDAIYCACR